MKNLKRIAASVVAAAAAVTSVAVTASADYKISGVNGDNGKYYLQIVGVPEQISNDPQNHPVGSLIVRFPLNYDDRGYPNLVFTVLNRTNEVFCRLMTDAGIEAEYSCELVTLGDELGFRVEFSADDDTPLGLSLTDTAFVFPMMAGDVTYDSNGNVTGGNMDFYSGDGTLLSGDDGAGDYTKEVSISWEPRSVHNVSEPESEPASEPESEPASEPESEPASEPESEPASEPAVTAPESEPVTEPESSEAPSTSQNPNSGFNGIGFVYAAVIAAGVAVVAHKRK